LQRGLTLLLAASSSAVLFQPRATHSSAPQGTYFIHQTSHKAQSAAVNSLLSSDTKHTPCYTRRPPTPAAACFSHGRLPQR
jgi:hypothetical protein